jgi:hypothetical protein
MRRCNYVRLLMAMIACRPVHAGHGVGPDALAASVYLRADAVMLNLVGPAVRDRRALGPRRQAGVDEAVRACTPIRLVIREEYGQRWRWDGRSRCCRTLS